MNEIKKQTFEELFKDHTVTAYGTTAAPDFGPVEFLTWRKPESNTYWIDYLFYKGQLVVTGDVGEAVYWWGNHSLDLSWVSKCELDYFAGKCRASEEGRAYCEWNVEEVTADLHAAIKRRQSEWGGSDELWAEVLKLSGGGTPFYNQLSWTMFLSSEVEERVVKRACASISAPFTGLYQPTYAELFYGKSLYQDSQPQYAGRILNRRVEVHLEGLRHAFLYIARTAI